MAATASHAKPLFIAAPNSKNFPAKPANGGMPTRDRKKTVDAIAAKGYFFPNPLKSSTVVPANRTIAYAPMFMAA